MDAPKPRMKKRLFRVAQVFCLILVLLIFRTAYIQIVQGSWLQKQAIEQQTRDRMISSKRGSIFDRNGKPLAVSVSAEVVSVTPAEIKTNEERGITNETIANELAQILELDKASVLAKITKSSFYEIIKRKVDKPQADLVRAYIKDNKIKGINLDEDIKRYYPYGAFASQVIGFVGTDNQGLEGIEKVMDDELKGTMGRVVSAKNARGVEMPFEYERMVDPQDGLSVVLTLDEGIQQFAEKHLESALIENRLANGAAAIVMEVKTGEILAMATMPDYDLNAPMTLTNPTTLAQVAALPAEEQTKRKTEELTKLWRNKAVVDTYEPGSTFKIFTAAMGLEENVVKMDDSFYCGGSVKVATENIRCWKAGGHGQQTFVQGIENSCNPVFIAVGARVGAAKFFSYYKGFGFLQKTGIELGGEAIGPFHLLKNFHELELATSSFGQSFQVTPLQMIAGVSAIANDGNMVRPRVVKALQDSAGNVVKSYETETVRQIVSKETSSALRQLLEKVVSEGTASNAYVSGYRVAGKTGTSEKIEMIDGKMQRAPGKYIASFVGFAPADNPTLACIVILDEPTGGQYFGGVIAAPVVGKILGESLAYLSVEPQYTAHELETMEAPVPDVRGLKVVAAQQQITAKKLNYKVIGSGEEIVNQIPKAGARVNVNSTVTLYTTGETTSKMAVVPNVNKLTVAQATQSITNAGLNIKITGAGATQNAGGNVIAFSQSIAAGAQVEAGTIVSVEFRTLEVDE
ncbi:stage V sporulation protein D [Clostridia bacterium]|nr:stage V sporulation protein D [Clostridia bacterium]